MKLHKLEISILLYSTIVPLRTRAWKYKAQYVCIVNALCTSAHADAYTCLAFHTNTEIGNQTKFSEYGKWQLAAGKWER